MTSLSFRNARISLYFRVRWKILNYSHDGQRCKFSSTMKSRKSQSWGIENNQSNDRLACYVNLYAIDLFFEIDEYEGLHVFWSVSYLENLAKSKFQSSILSRWFISVVFQIADLFQSFCLLFEKLRITKN